MRYGQHPRWDSTQAHVFGPTAEDEDGDGDEEWERGPDGRRDYGPTVSWAIDDYLADLAERGRKAHTVRQYRSVLYGMARDKPSWTRLRELRADDIRPFIEDQSIRPSTSRFRDAVIRVWLRWCRRTGRMTRDPLENVPHPIVNQPRTPPPPDVSPETDANIRAFSWEPPT